MSESVARATRNNHETLIAANPEEHAAMAAELLARAIVEAATARGVARVALSGGSTPSDTYRHLAGLALPWDQVEWYWVDERAVPPDSPRSNFSAAAADLDLYDGARGRPFRMEGEAEDLPAAAAAYEGLLRTTFGVASAVAFDAMTVGIGDDGHTASLFPGTGAVAIDDRLVIAVPEQPEKGLEARISLTAPVLREARLVVMIVRGAAKRDLVAKARQEGSEDEIPSRIYLGAKGRVVWVLDREAAGG